MTHHRIFRCSVTHVRLQPIRRMFRYRQSWFGLDLDQTAFLDRYWPLLGNNRFALLSFYDQDHFVPGSGTLAQRIRSYATQQGLSPSDCRRIVMLSHLRNLGYVFNPITVFLLCRHSRDSKALDLAAVLIEVGNTFGEQKLFWCGPENVHGNRATFETKKNFYVSPFIDLDANFRFVVDVKRDGDVGISATTVKCGATVLHATIQATDMGYGLSSVCRSILSFPLVTVKVISAIHWQAARLWLRRFPYLKKEDSPQLQVGVLDGKDCVSENR